MKHISLPADESAIRGLTVGDQVLVSGVMVTARDAAHKYLVENDDPDAKKVLAGSMIYHCGPVVAREEGAYRFVSAGPTTSEREEPYEAAVIRRYGVRGIIGKGGMGARTLDALKTSGAAYLHAVGGLAVLLAKSVEKVEGVMKLEEFGVPEAMWIIRVRDFPAVVTMDSHGGNLHAEISRRSAERLHDLLAPSPGDTGV
ncbi:MAG: fumarate hydratase C-terminal domain-containing protein [Deltaproteobacteria bacterium]|nr:fumarate hydratase C-terminal domain-containing protein [Deltaproteobacteria bacterium]